MAKNTNKRIAVKHIRDRAKSGYTKDTACYICSTAVDLELHHLHSITVLLETWAARKGYDLSTDEKVIEVRDEFISEHKIELYDLVFTLCNTHHVALHSIYGKAPSPTSVDKQRNWIEKQKAKNDGRVIDTPIKEVTKNLGTFSQFY